VLLAHDFDDLVGGVGVVGVGEDVLGGVEVVGVFVAAEDVNGIAADAQAGTGDEALIDCVANGGVSGACALSAHVSLGGESGEEVGFGGFSGDEGAPGDGFLDGLQVFRAGMEEEMDVGVDEAREQGNVAEVDDFGVLGMVDGCGDGADAVAFDEDFAGLEDCAGVDLEEAGGVEDDGLGLLGVGDEWRKSQTCAGNPGVKAFMESRHGYDYAASGSDCREWFGWAPEYNQCID
jgi:hypothetical protein